MKNNEVLTAWNELNGHLLTFVTKKVEDRETAKDVVQDVFLKVQSNASNLKDQEKLNSWIFQITRNAINDHFRNQKKHQQVVRSDEPVATLYLNDETAELSKCVLPMIDLLPEKYREALKLSDIDGMSQKDLAEHLQISYSAAKSRVQRAREKLKGLFLDCCNISTDKYGNVIEYHSKNCCGSNC